MRLTQTDPSQLLDDRIAAEVRAEIARQGISQEALAERLGWSQVRVSRRVSAGKTAVSFTVAELAAVATALNVPFAQFLPRELAAA